MMSTVNAGTRKLRFAMVAHVAVAALVVVLAYIGRLPLPMPTWMMADKVMHFTLVGGIAFWIVGGWDDPRLKLGSLCLPLAILLPLAIAAAEEALQLLSPRRSADLADFAADALGLVAFWWLGLRILRSKRATASG